MNNQQTGRGKVISFVKGSAVLVLSSVFIKAVNFFLLPLYTNNLTPSMLGVSDSITTLTGFLSPLLIMGLDSAYSAFYFEKDDSDRGRKVYGTLSLTFFIVGLLPLFCIAGSGVLSVFLFKTSAYTTEIAVSLMTISLNIWYLPFSLEMRMKNEMRKFGIISAAASVSMVCLNILFVSVIRLNEMALILSSAIAALEQLVLYVLFSIERPHVRYFEKGLLKKMLVFAIPMVPSVVMMWVLSLSDRYVLLYCQGEEAVGIYGIGLRFTTVLNVVISALSTAYTTFAFGTKDDKNARKDYYYIFNVVSLALFVISFSVGIFGKEMIMIVTEKSYLLSYKTLRDLMFGQSLYAMSSFVAYGILFKKKSVYSLIAVSAGAVVNLVLNLLLIPKYGMLAAAFTTLLGYLISFILNYFFSVKLYPCFYGIKKVAVTFCILYTLCFFGEERNLIVKIVIWIITMLFLICLYREIMVTIKNFAVSFLPGQKIRKDNYDE